VTYTINDASVSFTGTSSVIGTYSGITVTGVDSLGSTASIAITFKVLSSSDPIELNVSTIKTKVDYPIIMEPPFAAATLTTGNTYGTITFSSDNLPSVPGVSLDPATGYIEGTVSTAQNLNFDLVVTDETNRITRKPVLVSVLPKLRMIMPSQVQAEQGKVVSAPVATDYVLGKVTYEKGAGDWPLGFVVNPATGEITSSYVNPTTGKTTANVIAAAGTYSGLTVVGKDTFGIYTDQQQSNPFAIVVQPSTAEPDIANQPKTILGTEGAPIVDWGPKAQSGWAAGVIEKGKNANAWNLGGTVYMASHDLSDYGLTFDRATGMITGTPTKPFIIRDFVITVTSQRGDTDSTTPFWIGVAPKDAMAIPSGFKTAFSVRKGSILDTTDLQWNNSIGNLTHVKVSGDNAFSVASSTGRVNAVNTTTNWTVGTYPVGIRVTDEFNRTATTTVKVTVSGVLTVTGPYAQVMLNVADSDIFTPTVAGLLGTVTYTVTGLPQGIDYDAATGRIYGMLDTSKYTYNETEWSVTVTVSDSGDGALASADGTLKIPQGGYRYFRILDTGSYSYWGCAYFDVYNEFGQQINSLSTTPYGSTRHGVNKVTAQSKVNDGCQVSRQTSVGYWLSWDFKSLQNVTRVTVRYDNGWNAANSIIRAPQFQGSNDNVTWDTLWTGTTTGSAMSKTYTKP
jgi:hypothetical protein